MAGDTPDVVDELGDDLSVLQRVRETVRTGRCPGAPGPLACLKYVFGSRNELTRHVDTGEASLHAWHLLLAPGQADALASNAAHRQWLWTLKELPRVVEH